MSTRAIDNIRKPQRLRALQSLRGLAILGVLIYHLGFRWATAVHPDGNYSIPGAEYGKYGVQLFFVISGFVIAGSAEKATSVRAFLANRFSRLAPGVLITVPALFAVELVTQVTELHKLAVPMNLLPSLTLVPPAIWNSLGFHTAWVAGVAWTLSIEWTFYLVVALISRLSQLRWLPEILLSAAVASGVIHAALVRGFAGDSLANSLDIILQSLGYLHIAWFALGSIFWRTYKTGWHGKILAQFVAAYGIAAYSILGGAAHLDVHGIVECLFIAGLIVVPFFMMSVAPDRTESMPQSALARVGDSSYELYLIHEVVGVCLLAAL